jgi:hypothetical protein
LHQVTPAPDAASGSSPYERALGSTLDALHPRLRTYLGAIPPGHVGRGHGTFDVVGTPRRSLWPLLAVLGRMGIAFPVHEFRVPFSIENRPGRSASVAATRCFDFKTGTRRMTDVMQIRRGRLLDVLGTGGHVRALFEAVVDDGALDMRSVAVGLRIGGLRLRVPDLVAPRVRLVERFDDASESQHVDVTLEAPLIGRLYEYSGSFTYQIRPEEEA